MEKPTLFVAEMHSILIGYIEYLSDHLERNPKAPKEFRRLKAKLEEQAKIGLELRLSAKHEAEAPKELTSRQYDLLNTLRAAEADYRALHATDDLIGSVKRYLALLERFRRISTRRS